MKSKGHPILKSVHSVDVLEPVFSTRWKEDSLNANIYYIGESSIGADESLSAWRIQQVNTTTGEIKFAGNGQFNQNWQNREALTYL